jgi:protein-disulfide isomerase
MTMRISRFVITVVCALAIGMPSAACGQTQAQGISQQQADQMLKELKAIREALERVSPPAGQPEADKQASLDDLKGRPVMGKPDAPLTLVEFTDLQCPYCNRFTSTTFEQIKAAYIDTGMVRFVSRDFPLDFHAQALPAARATRCAGDQGKYYEMRFALLRNAARLSPAFITTTAEGLKLDMGAFTACATSTLFDDAIKRDMDVGMKLGIEGTPSFVLGRTTPAGVTGVLVIGAQPFQVFDAKIKQQLGAK